MCPHSPNHVEFDHLINIQKTLGNIWWTLKPFWRTEYPDWKFSRFFSPVPISNRRDSYIMPHAFRTPFQLIFRRPRIIRFNVT